MSVEKPWLCDDCGRERESEAGTPHVCRAKLRKSVDYTVKDSGKREEFPSGMRRDTEDGKTDYTLLFDGPLADRYSAHLTKGAAKYGEKNWQLAATEAEYKRFRRSAARHFIQWLRGQTDEDHAAAAAFNIFAAEYVKDRLAGAGG